MLSFLCLYNFDRCKLFFLVELQEEKAAGKRMRAFRLIVGDGYEGNLVEFSNTLWNEFNSKNF